MCSATAWARCLKSSVLATKSDSQLTSTSTPTRPTPPEVCTYDSMMPSPVLRPAFLAARAMPCSRSQSLAFSMSPPVSVRARLLSIMPAPVMSRSCFTSAAVISATLCLLGRGHGGLVGRLLGHALRLRLADRRSRSLGLGASTLRLLGGTRLGGRLLLALTQLALAEQLL